MRFTASRRVVSIHPTVARSLDEKGTPPFGGRVCVCVCVCVRPLKSQGSCRIAKILLVFIGGGQSHIAVDCPTKRAAMWLISGRDAFWTDLLGCGVYKLLLHFSRKVLVMLVSSAGAHGPPSPSCRVSAVRVRGPWRFPGWFVSSYT